MLLTIVMLDFRIKQFRPLKHNLFLIHWSTGLLFTKTTQTIDRAKNCQQGPVGSLWKCDAL